MQPTTVTTLVLIAFGFFVLGLTARAYFGSWETRTPHTRLRDQQTAAVELEVRRLRQEISEYERRNRLFDDTR
jgi:hypothetical protein